MSDQVTAPVRVVSVRDINWTRGRLDGFVHGALRENDAPYLAVTPREVADRVLAALRLACVERRLQLEEPRAEDLHRLRSIVGRILNRLCREPRSLIRRVSRMNHDAYWRKPDPQPPASARRVA